MSTKKCSKKKISLVSLNNAVETIAFHCHRQSMSVTDSFGRGSTVINLNDDQNLVEAYLTTDKTTWNAAIGMLLQFELEYGPITQYKSFSTNVSPGEIKDFRLTINTEFDDAPLTELLRSLFTKVGG